MTYGPVSPYSDCICPFCDEMVLVYPHHCGLVRDEELPAESDWDREMQERAEEDMDRADREREAMEYAQGFERGIE